MIRLASKIVAAAALVGLWSLPAGAGELQPIQGRSITLGPITGVAYYTAEAAGDRIVATLSGADGATPMRVVAVLTPGQSMTLSVPRGPGESAIEVAFSRRGNRVFVTDGSALTN